MCRRGAEAARLLPAAALALLALLALTVARPAEASPSATGVEISPTVRRTLQQLQEQWLQWLGATNAQSSEAQIADMLATAHELGMARLPDLCLGALEQAVQAARGRDMVRARWELAAAERLDPERPETAFARMTVAHLEGDYTGMLSALATAGVRFFRQPSFRAIWLHSLVLWGLALLLTTGGLFIAALMATRGRTLLRDLTALLARFLPHAAALAGALAVLLWPLALPAGLLWVVLLWSLLLWGYASPSQRAILIVLWLVLGAMPLVVAEERRHVSVELSPPVQAMESLDQQRLYGDLFTDLGVLRSVLPDSPAVKQLFGDVHRMLNQWDQASAFYHQVLEAEPKNAPALLDLGANAFFKADWPGAIQYFGQASAADPHSAAAQFDLSQAYSQSYLFDEQRRALAVAQGLDSESVDQWLRRTDQQRVVVASEGLRRIPEIRRQLLLLWHGPEALSLRLELLRHGLSLALPLVFAILGIGIHLSLRSTGPADLTPYWRLGHRHASRWRRVLVPGLSAAEAGEGGRAFLALLLPAALAMLPVFGWIGYRLPWGYDPGSSVLWIVSVSGLLLYFAARLRWELRNAV